MRLLRTSPFLAVLTLVVGVPYERKYEPRGDAHQRAVDVLDNYPLTDGHNDLAWQMRERILDQLDLIDLSRDVVPQWGWSHTDIPRMRAGQVGAQFWAAYVGCDKLDKDAVRATMEQVDVIRRFVTQYNDTFQPALTGDDIEAAFAAGKIASLIGIEGGHSIDNSFASVRMFYDLGTRYMTLTHNCNLPWAQSNVDDSTERDVVGLTPWGQQMVLEMNRMGMLVDLSHTSHATQMDALNVTQAPAIFSHSSVYSLCNHPRNVHDDVLQRLAQNQGIIMITFVAGFVNCPPTNAPVTDIAVVADHIDYVKNLIGADYVGIAGDYDGASSYPVGLEDVTGYPSLFEELINRGWSDPDLEKLAGRNIVRVMRAAEQVAASGGKANDTPIPEADVPANVCRTGMP